MEVDSKGFENLSRIHYKYRRNNFYNVKNITWLINNSAINKEQLINIIFLKIYIDVTQSVTL